MKNFNRRCRNHDYRSRCIYMITILKSASAPVFSSISPDPGAPKISPIVTLTPIGEIIQKCLDSLLIENPALRILNRSVMPDHLHFELFVTEPTEEHLGSLIASFKSACTKAYRNLYQSAETEKRSLFESGFNDKITFRAGAKDAFYNYIADNPRRYLVKKICPEYFYHKLKIEVEGISCGLYGNIFLLDHPTKSFVKISRIPDHTPDLDKKIREWEETIRCGGVLVSPFINPEEKIYRDKAIENNNGLIIIVDYTFSEREKPYKALFDLCEEGRLLIISTEEYAAPPREMRYSQASKMNAIAAAVAKLAPRSAKILPR